ncbi:hypothetical protein CYMTET_15551 [Cymbomonas tetramitiformis]|uniref:protein-tyrosine-phosphatase n=1 Tax=Cymbomonas tetramitiformis TaxID=36881 RepID=A0AAE0L962_9CHLO|nr:hypothetical protein CYMTET_15551 [Cymbomonas tetramitiformis]
MSAAENIQILRKHDITHIVNCQDVTSKNYHENDPSFHYLRFPIAHWWSAGLETPDKVLEFFSKYFEFIDRATAEGKSVLIHCLAGAHRAGTATIALLMYKADMDAATATVAAQTCRDIINPIGGLDELLKRLEKSRNLSGNKTSN